MKVSLLVTCLGDALFPDVGVATVRLLRRLGVEVDFPAAQTCCGQPHFNSGYHDDARQLARHTIEAFANGQMVVTPSGSCAAMVKLEFPELFHADQPWRERAEDLARRTHELSEFIVNVLGVEDVGARFEGKVTYHMACHLRGLGVTTEPERLLRKVRGLELVPLERCDECCGFGGSFSVRFPGISGAMVGDKAAFIEKTGADAVVATDAGCLMNIGGCLRRRGSKVRALHLAQVLEKRTPSDSVHPGELYNGSMSSKHVSTRPRPPARWYEGADIPMRVIREFARRVAERFRPEKIILFGSYAYGTPHADSDVDILVVMPTRNQLDQAFKIRLAFPAPFPMDLIVRTPRSMKWRLEEGESFLMEIVSKGKVLYEKDDGSHDRLLTPRAP